MSSSVAGKRVIVTGGARGIAAATATVLAREGANVITLDINDEAGLAVASQATLAGPGWVRYLHADVTKRAEIFEAIDHGVDLLGGLDAICCAAGIERGGAAETLAEQDWDEVFDINVKGLMFCNQAAFRHLKSHGGSIINFGSDAGLKPGPVGAHYAATKGAVFAYTRQAAYEWGRYGIRVNSVVPAIWTPLYDEFRQRQDAEALALHDAAMAAAIPLGGKLGDPETDLAPVMSFLVSDGSKFISGQIISVNGALGYVR